MYRKDFLKITTIAGLGIPCIWNSCTPENKKTFENTPEYGDVDIYDPKTQIPKGLPSIIDRWMRDPVITLGRDGEYILTGTTRIPEYENSSRWSDGLYAWRSMDMRIWEPLGLVWKLDEGPEWIRNFHVYYPEGGKIVAPETFYNNIPENDILIRRSLWSPRITFSRKHDTYLAACSMNFNMGIPADKWINPIFGGTFVLKSISGEAQGPYEITCDHPLTQYIDCRIIEDDDQTLYFIWQSGYIGKLNDKLDGLYEVYEVWQNSFDPEPVKEGIHIFKYDSLYYLVLSMFSHKINGETTYRHKGHGGTNAMTYDAVVATSKNIYGPYGERYTSITDGGHANHFMDRDGNWWACVFHDDEDHNNSNGLGINPRLVPMKWQEGKIYPRT